MCEANGSNYKGQSIEEREYLHGCTHSQQQWVWHHNNQECCIVWQETFASANFFLLITGNSSRLDSCTPTDRVKTNSRISVLLTYLLILALISSLSLWWAPLYGLPSLFLTGTGSDCTTFLNCQQWQHGPVDPKLGKPLHVMQQSYGLAKMMVLSKDLHVIIAPRVFLQARKSWLLPTAKHQMVNTKILRLQGNTQF